MGTAEIVWMGIGMGAVVILTVIGINLMKKVEAGQAVARREMLHAWEDHKHETRQQLEALAAQMKEAVLQQDRERKFIQEHLLLEHRKYLNEANANGERAVQNILDRHVAAIEQTTQKLARQNQEKIEEYGQQLVRRLDVYIEAEEQQAEAWMERAKTADSQAKKIEMLETALNQVPSSCQLFDMLAAELLQLASSADRKVRKSALEKLNRASRVFLDHCAVDDWEHAYTMMTQTLKGGNLLVRELEQERLRQLEADIEALEQAVQRASGSKQLSAAHAEALKQADESIDKAWLEKQPQLKARYAKAAESLVSLFHQQSDEEAKAAQAYNENAVRAIKQAHEAFLADEKRMKKGEGMQRLAQLLGGWDTRYLSMPSQVYYQAVYTEIFSKLNPDVKPAFTELVLQSPAKKAV